MANEYLWVNILYPGRGRGQASIDTIAPVYSLYHEMLMYTGNSCLTDADSRWKYGEYRRRWERLRLKAAEAGRSSQQKLFSLAVLMLLVWSPSTAAPLDATLLLGSHLQTFHCFSQARPANVEAEEEGRQGDNSTSWWGFFCKIIAEYIVLITIEANFRTREDEHTHTSSSRPILQPVGANGKLPLGVHVSFYNCSIIGVS